MGHFSRFGAHLLLEHFSQFDPKVPHFSRKYPPVILLESDAPVAVHASVSLIPGLSPWQHPASACLGLAALSARRYRSPSVSVRGGTADPLVVEDGAPGPPGGGGGGRRARRIGATCLARIRVAGGLVGLAGS